MKIRVLVQIGIYDKKPEEQLKLSLTPPSELFNWAMNDVFHEMKTKQHKLCDGSTYMIEYEGNTVA